MTSTKGACSGKGGGGGRGGMGRGCKIMICQTEVLPFCSSNGPHKATVKTKWGDGQAELG